MRVMKLLATKALAVAIALTMLPAALPANVPLVGVTAAKADQFNGRHFRGGRDFGGYRGGRHYGGYRGDYGRRYYRRRGHHNNGGAAVAGALLGLGVGAAIASAAQPRYIERGPRYIESGPRSYGYGGLEPWSRGWYRYCASRYRSFDSRSGTFQPYGDVPRQFCR